MDQLVLKELIENKNYCRKAIPYLYSELFSRYEDQLIYRGIKQHIVKYKNLPTYTTLKLFFSNLTSINEDSFENIQNRINEIENEKSEEHDLTWLIDETENWCVNRAFSNALIKSVEITKDPSKNKGEAIDLMKKALTISFNPTIGIEFYNEDDIDERYEKYHEKRVKFPTHLKQLNWLTGGGLSPKTLSVLLGGTHSGKTNAMISLAMGLMENGVDVLYVTLEMSKEEITKRMDANSLNVPINDIDQVSKTNFKGGLMKKNKKTNGRLIVEEFPTSTANVDHIRALLEDLNIKKDFRPQVIFVDYINIMQSARFNEGNSYTLIKSISEELRGLAVEGEYALVSATQTNKDGQKSSNPDMADTAESFGLPVTVDLYIAIISNDDLIEQKIQLWKCLKNRLTGIINKVIPIRTEFQYARLSDMTRDEVENRGLEDIQGLSGTLLKKEESKELIKGIKVNNIKKDIENLSTEDEEIF